MLRNPSVLPIAISAVVGIAVALRCAGWYKTSGGRSGKLPSALIINGQAFLSGDEEPSGLLVDGIDAVFRSIEDLAFTIETGRVRVYETIDERDLADFGLVQVAAYPRPTATLISAIADYLQIKKVPAVNMAGIGAPTKLFQYVRFAQAGLPVPVTVYLAPQLLASSYADLAEKLGLPFVLKAMSASGGRFNYLVSNECELTRHLRYHGHAGVRFLAQEFIPNDTTFRLLVFGGEVSLVMRRTSVGTIYLTNTAQGGHTVLVDPAKIDPAVKRLAVRAASLIGCDIAGVNVIQHWTTGQWYVLDANSNPAIGTGAFAADKLEAYSSYLRRRLTGSRMMI